MPLLRNIFLVSDIERPRSPAFERARALAASAGAHVHAGYVGSSQPIRALAIASATAMEQAREGFMANAHRSVEQQASYLRVLGIAASSSSVWAHPVLPELMAQIDEQKVELVIKDAAQDSQLKNLLTTTLDQQLLRRCPVPLMLTVDDGLAAPGKVLVGIDVMEGNAAVNRLLMQHALGIALRCGAELHLAYVCEPLSPLGSEILGGSVDAGALVEEIYRDRREAFGRMVAAERIPLDRAHYLKGQVAATLCNFARENACDLIVVATAGRSRLDRWLMGSTAEDIVRQAPCSLLSIPAELAGK